MNAIKNIRAVFLATVVLAIFTTTSVNGQTYSLEVANQTYEHLKGSTSLNNGEIWDDPDYEVPIGFTFKYFDFSFDKLFFDPEGFGGMLSASTGKIGSSTLIIVHSSDLADRGLLTEDSDTPVSLSNLSYLLEGSAGSRILKIEWRNAGFFNDMDENDTSIDFINYQCWFYEGSNTIEIHFGPKLITQPDLAFDSENGPFVGLARDVVSSTGVVDSVYLVLGKPTSPVLKVLTEDDIDTATNLFLDGMIPEGTVYRFVRKGSSVSVPELSSIHVQVYPNPANDELFISTGDVYKMADVSVIDALGKVVLTSQFSGKQTRIDLSSLASGVYGVRIETESGAASTKFVKH